MMKGFVLFFIAAITIVGVQDAYSTHISQPIITVDNNLVYSIGDSLSITGWVEYDDASTSDVLLSVKISNSNGTVVSDFFLTSDSDGKFEFPFQLSDDDSPGDYSVNIMSMCREIHRDVCTHKTAEIAISVIGEESKIPEWVRNVFVWYAENSISEKELLQALQYLINQNIIQVEGVDNT